MMATIFNIPEGELVDANEALIKENKRLREALEEIVTTVDVGWWFRIINIASAALKENE